MTDHSASLGWDVYVAPAIAETTSTAQDLYDQVLGRYPDRVNPDALWISAQGVKPSPR